MAVGTIILGRLMSPEEYGLYSVALPTYMIILFRNWGVNSAITRHIANLRAENKKEDIYDIIFRRPNFRSDSGASPLHTIYINRRRNCG